MDYTHLGRTGLSVSRLCLGTMNFGPETTEEDSYAIMDRALDLGINFFDTANVYGWKKGEGVTEQIVGRWFAQGGDRRDKTVIATKLYGSMSDWPNDTFLSARNIRRACDASLQRLQTDYIDLYQMHHVDRDTPWDEIWEAFDVLAHAGQGALLRLVQPRRLAYREGPGGRAATRLARAGQRAVHLQPADPRRGARGAAGLPGLRRRRDPVVAAARWPARRHHPQDREGQAAPGRPREGVAGREPKAIKAWEDLCDEMGENPADVGLAWLLHQPAVTAPIIGPRTMEQLDGRDAGAEDPAEQGRAGPARRDLPRPRRRRPEAYAW